ncbi:MAG: fumarate/nitrate reduction transcriptional regulator Fnr [Gammaproteobacteria bacterium]
MAELKQVVDISQVKVSCAECRLKEIGLPRGLDPAEVSQLKDLVKRNPLLKRGEYLYRQGDPLRGLYAVRSGSLKIFISAQDGAEHVVGFYLPGELLGLDAMGWDCHTCAAVALETTSVCELPYDRLEELCHQLPSLQHQLLRIVGKEVSADHEQLLLLGERSAEERIATFVLNLSTRFGERGFSEKEFNLSMSRHDIASYLGLAVETVSRLFTSFSKEGLLSVERRNVRMLDFPRLRSMASGSMPCPTTSTK